MKSKSISSYRKKLMKKKNQRGSGLLSKLAKSKLAKFRDNNKTIIPSNQLNANLEKTVNQSNNSSQKVVTNNLFENNSLQTPQQDKTKNQSINSSFELPPDASEQFVNMNPNTMTSMMQKRSQIPIMFLINIFLYGLFTAAGSLIYYPSFLINLPNSTLEKLIPTEEGCKNIIGDELICKKKIKCFFKKCTILEDPIGTKIQKQKENLKKTRKDAFVTKGGNSKKNKTIKNIKRSFNNMKILKKMNIILNKDKKRFLQLIHKILNDNKNKKRKHVGGYRRQINQKTCTNYFSNIYCDGETKRKIIYPSLTKEDRDTRRFLTTMRKLMSGGGNNDNVSENNVILFAEKLKNTLNRINSNYNESNSSNLKMKNNSARKNNRSINTNSYENNINFSELQDEVDVDVVVNFLNEHFDNESLFKLLITYKIFEKLYKNNIDYSEVQDIGQIKSKSGVEVIFPWHQMNSELTIDEKRKCLFKHLTQMNVGDEYETDDFYQKCFICKNCTLLNTSVKAWEELFSSLFTTSENELKKLSKDLYNILMKNVNFELMEPHEYYISTLYAMNLVDPELNINTLNNPSFNLTFQGHNLVDLIFGIPKVKNVTVVNASDKLGSKFKQIFLLFEKLKLKETIHSLCYNKIFDKINKVKQDSDRLYFIKENIKYRVKLFYGNINYNFLINNINIDNLKDYRIRSENTGKDFTQHYFIKEFEKQDSKFQELFNILLNKDNFNEFVNSPNNNNDELKNILVYYNELNKADTNKQENKN